MAAYSGIPSAAHARLCCLSPPIESPRNAKHIYIIYFCFFRHSRQYSIFTQKLSLGRYLNFSFDENFETHTYPFRIYNHFEISFWIVYERCNFTLLVFVKLYIYQLNIILKNNSVVSNYKFFSWIFGEEILVNNRKSNNLESRVFSFFSRHLEKREDPGSEVVKQPRYQVNSSCPWKRGWESNRENAWLYCISRERVNKLLHKVNIVFNYFY